MKFYLVCALILSIAFFVATASPIAEDQLPMQGHSHHDHHNVVRSLGVDITAGGATSNKDGEVACCG
ncbi:uncharacterized protein Dwil_GK12276 [Drosophila willistoni]|uniref:Tes115 n=1 Tax=Drosophila willistoni TaxID=7260 RepID=B4N6Q1_DROWI|nr:uncharacterized protein Dwil_GK12276 [Drosophila willistoni]